jgi:hypothetical protein
MGLRITDVVNVSRVKPLKCVGSACLNLEKTHKVWKSQKGFGADGLGLLRREMGLPENHSQVSLFTLFP